MCRFQLGYLNTFSGVSFSLLQLPELWVSCPSPIPPQGKVTYLVGQLPNEESSLWRSPPPRARGLWGGPVRRRWPSPGHAVSSAAGPAALPGPVQAHQPDSGAPNQAAHRWHTPR